MIHLQRLISQQLPFISVSIIIILVSTSSSYSNLSEGSSCSDSRKCKYGYGCDSSENCYRKWIFNLVCSDKQCKTCDSNDTQDKCIACWKSSTKWNQVIPSPGNTCPCNINII